MRNLWIQTEPPFATWIADFTAVATQPSAILTFVQTVLASGAKHRVFDVVEAPSLDYARGRDGTLSGTLRRLLEHDRVLDLFGFMGAAMLPGHPQSSTTEATLCHYDRDDRLVESIVTDLGAVLASLEPVPDSIPNGFMKHYPAVRITGKRYSDVDEGIPVDRSSRPYPVAALIAIHSDIWFPWTFGSAHPKADHIRMFDNRELANGHTPRLNSFLREIGEAARQVGGTFDVWADGTSGPFINWVDDQSVLLDWMPPDGIMSPETLNIEWTSL